MPRSEEQIHYRRSRGRGLLLSFNGQRRSGLANIWLAQKLRVTLNIAELYIRSDHQREGLGSALWYAVPTLSRTVAAAPREKRSARLTQALPSNIQPQCRKCRTPVMTMAMLCSSAAAMTSSSRTEPPG
jgi:hypothetical protein